jgi:hypothetical protein
MSRTTYMAGEVERVRHPKRADSRLIVEAPHVGGRMTMSLPAPKGYVDVWLISPGRWRWGWEGEEEIYEIVVLPGEGAEQVSQVDVSKLKPMRMAARPRR